MGKDTNSVSSDIRASAECQQLLQNYLENTADAYYLHDLDGIILDVNTAACKNLGYTRAELLELNVGDIEKRFPLPELKSRWQKLKPGHAYRFDALHLRKNGSLVLVSGTAQRFKLSGKDVIIALSHSLPEQAGIQSEPGRDQVAGQSRCLQLERAQKLARLGIWQRDTLSDQASWDDTMCAIFGYTLEDYPRNMEEFLAIVHPQSRAGLETALQTAFARREPYEFEYKIIQPSGEIRAIHEQGYISEVNEQGEPAVLFGFAQDITERKELEEKITQSELRFRLLVEQSPDAFYLHDLQGNILDVSPRTCQELGYSREELLQLNIRDIEQSASYDKLLHDWANSQVNEHRIYAGINRRKDRSEFPVEIHNRRFDINGKPYLLALVRDTSGQQNLARLMELILRSTARHSGGDFLQLLVRELAETLQVKTAFVSRIVNTDAQRLRVVAMWQDGQFLENFEYDIADTPCERVFKEELITIPDNIQRIFPRDHWLKQHEIESYIAIAFYNMRAEPLGHLGIMHDAPLRNLDVIQAALRIFACHAAAHTERMELEHALLNRERQLETLVAINRQLNNDLNVQQVMRTLILAGQKLTSATAGACGLLQNGQIIFTEYMQGATILPIDFRFSSDEGVPGHVLRTQRSYISNDPQHDPYVIQEIQEALKFTNLANVPILDKQGKLLGCFEMHNKPDGGFSPEDIEWLQTLAANAAIALENAQLLSNLRHSKLELEQRVADRTADLVVTNRELESFSYSVSHDLRTPLRTIKGFSNVLLEDEINNLSDTGKDYLGRIVRATMHMQDIIEAMLKLSKIIRSPLSRESFDLSKLVSDVADTIRANCGNRPIDFEIEPDIHINADRLLLRAAITNLLENACKFTSLSEQPRIHVGCTRHNNETQIFVKDNGIGFDMEFAEHLFQPFQRLHTDAQFDGMGIGLATVQRIVHRHGGRIWAEGQPGKGAIFYFTIPD